MAQVVWLCVFLYLIFGQMDMNELPTYAQSILDQSFLSVLFEHDEYIDSGKSSKRAAGTEIEGNLQIEFVNDFSSSNERPFYCQNTPQSPSIHAVVDVIEVIDDFSIKANLSGYTIPITVEFERRIPGSLSGRILIYGELQIDISS